MQAAFGLVVVTCGMGTTVFNFLVDGVVAKVGTAIGARRWDEASGRVRAALVAALVCGGTATAVLLTLRAPLFVLFGADRAVTARARAYYAFRASAIPLQCVTSSTNGCLGGYGRVHAATALGIARAAAEVVGVVAALALANNESDADGSDGRWERGAMVGMGVVYVACVAMHAAVGVTLVAVLVPDGRARDSGYSDAPIGGAGAVEEDGYVEVPVDAPVDAPVDETRLSDTPFLSDLADFAVDGASMLIRSVLLQGSFFAAMVCASRRLGATGLAAHHVVTQLWMCSAYLVDGVATAGTVSGSRLVGAAMVTREVPGGAGRRDGRTGTTTRMNEASMSGTHARMNEASMSGTHARMNSKRDPTFRSRMYSRPCARCARVSCSWRWSPVPPSASASCGSARPSCEDSPPTNPSRPLCSTKNSGRSSPSRSRSTRRCSASTDSCTRSRTLGSCARLSRLGLGTCSRRRSRGRTGKTPATLAAVWTAKVALNAWRLVVVGARIVGWCLTRRGLRARARGGGGAAGRRTGAVR